VTEQIRALVPAWVEWLGPLLFLVGTAAIVSLLPVAVVRGCVPRIGRAGHWTEQARSAHAARVSIIWAAATVPAAIWLLSTITIGPLGRMPSWLYGFGGVAVAVILIARSSWWLETSGVGQPLRGWSRFLSGFLIRLVPLASIIVLALAAPSSLASPWMILWVVLALMLAFALRFQLELLAAAGLAGPADDRLEAIVGRAATRAGVAIPTVSIIEHHRPNAFAFPWRGAVAFTSRAVAELSDEELESVALHELGHLAESAGSSRLRQATQFVWIPVAATKPVLGSMGLAGLLGVLVLMLGLLLVVRRFVTTMEPRSDEHAVAHVHESGMYGRALEKTYRIGLIPAVLRRPSHGQLHERLEAAGVASDFDPPAPPSMRPLVTSTAAALAVGLAIFMAPYLAMIGTDLSSPTPAHVALALGTNEAWSLERLGQLADLDGDLEAAAVFYTAAAQASPEADLLMNLVYVRSVLGHCDDAVLAMSELLGRNGSRGDVSLAAEWVDWCRQQWGYPS